MHSLRRWVLHCVLVLTSAVPARALAAPDAACLSAHRTSQQRRDDGKLMEARALLIECSADKCPGIVRQDCVEWLKQVDAALPSVVFRAISEGSDEPIADGALEVVWESGRHALDGRAVPMDPGTHTLRLMRDETTVASASVTILEAQKHQTVTFRVRSATAPAGGGLAIPLAPNRGERRSTALPWVLTAAGAVTLAAGATLSGTTWLALDDCHHDRNCSSSDAASIKTRLAVGDVTMGIGLVAAAVGVVMLVTGAGQAR